MGTSDQAILNRETLVQMLTPVQKCGFGYLSEFTGTPWEINEQQSYLVSLRVCDLFRHNAGSILWPSQTKSP